MRSRSSTILALALSLPLLVRSDQPFPNPGKGNGKGGDLGLGVATPPVVSVAVPNPLPGPGQSQTTTVTASVVSLGTTTVQNTPEPATVTKTIGVSTATPSASSSASSSAQESSASSVALVGTSSTGIMMSSVPMATSNDTDQSFASTHRTLVIILSTVLGSVGLILIAVVALLVYRYRKEQSPFGHRGASPIDDDEIASWRRNGMDQKLPTRPPEHGAAIREVSQIHMHSPGWTWTASPTSIRTISACIDSPSFLARAPNAREGLTDETVPGAEPYIASPRRQNSRLSKPPPGHIRSKSQRSSMSGKSMWSVSHHRDSSDDSKRRDRSLTWYDLETDSGSRHLTTRLDNGASSPETSVFDGLAVPGGLSPRPRSAPRPWEEKEIGRAIA